MPAYSFLNNEILFLLSIEIVGDNKSSMSLKAFQDHRRQVSPSFNLF